MAIIRKTLKSKDTGHDYKIIKLLSLVQNTLLLLQDLFTFFSTLLEIFDWGTDINNVRIYGRDCSTCNRLGTTVDCEF